MFLLKKRRIFAFTATVIATIAATITAFGFAFASRADYPSLEQEYCLVISCNYYTFGIRQGRR